MDEDCRGATGGDEVCWCCGNAEDVGRVGLVEGVEGEVLL